MVIVFEVFLQQRKVRSVKPNKLLGESLYKDGVKRFRDAQQMEPKYKLENSYEATRELIEALMAREGYKTYSHEVTIAYLQKFKEFTVFDIEQLDRIRKIRNNSKYYGYNINKDESDHDTNLLKPIIKKLKQLYLKQTTSTKK